MRLPRTLKLAPVARQMKRQQVHDRLEQSYFDQGYGDVVGIDEVGRGSWAGPVVVGAFVYRRNSIFIPEVNDSKKLSSKCRLRLTAALQHEQYAIALADADEIDELNIVNATRLAMHRAIAKLKLKNSIVLVDGYFREAFNFEHRCIIKGDEKHYSIAAGSILAKVYRDNLMIKLSKKYPHYGFETNVGYGTKKHQDALAKYGICKLHRKSYKPIRSLIS